MGFDSKHSFAPPAVLLVPLLCPWMWDMFFWWDPTVHSEGDQPWDFFGRNDAKAEAPVLCPPHVKS